MCVLLINIFFFLNLTIIIATITLIERKILALLQRRVGPNYIGYKGRLQFIADALKLLAKQIQLLNFVNKNLFIFIPCLILIICYLFWINIIWGPNLNFFEIEYNILLMSIISIFFSLCLFLVGNITKNKYAKLSSYRVIITTINLEIFLNFIFIIIIFFGESFSFYKFFFIQKNFNLIIFILLPLLPELILVFLLETGRIPFDLNEAESELIAGYTTEFGGFFFALFYLGEYFHLYCFSLVYCLLFFGG